VEYEWSRLERHRTELAVTMRAITAHLAVLGPKPLRIIDIGGGPGRYCLELSRLGHQVTLLDLSQANVERAREVTGGKLQGYYRGTATDLGRFGDRSFDAALLMGPLYHLLDEADRKRAVREACRVLVPDGLLFASFITAYAPIRDMAKYYPEKAAGFIGTPEATASWIKDGRWTAREGDGFVDAWFAHPEAVKPLMEGAGDLETLDLLAVEGVVSMIEDEVNKLQGPLWDYWVELNYRLAGDPCLFGGAEHLLYVGRKLRGRRREG